MATQTDMEHGRALSSVLGASPALTVKNVKHNVPNRNAPRRRPHANVSHHWKNGWPGCWPSSPSTCGAKGSRCPRFKLRCVAVGAATVTRVTWEERFARTGSVEKGIGMLARAFARCGILPKSSTSKNRPLRPRTRQPHGTPTFSTSILNGLHHRYGRMEFLL